MEGEDRDGPQTFRVTPTCVIRMDELDWRFSASGGPGGEHVNTAHTRAEGRFDIAGSPPLGARPRARPLDRLGPEGRAGGAAQRARLRTRGRALARAWR